MRHAGVGLPSAPAAELAGQPPGTGRPATFRLRTLVAGALALGTTVAVFIVFWSYRHWNFDDGFIVFRYVDNLRHGNGWSFNRGETWNASTSVLNPVLTLAASFVVRDIPLASHIVSSVALGSGAIALSWYFLREDRSLPAIAVPFLAAVYPPLYLTWGLESYLFLGLILAYLAFECGGRRTWALVGLLALVRPDGGIFVLLKTGREVVATRRIPWRGMAVSACVVAPWIVFSLWRFGSVVPDTFGSKRQQGALGAWGTGHIYLRGLKTDLLGFFHSEQTLQLVLVLAAVGAISAAVRRPRALADFGAFTVVQQLVYAVLNPPYYHWYGRIFSFSLAFYAVLGVEWVLSGLRPVRLRSAVFAVAGSMTAVLAVVHWLPRQTVPLGVRELAYRRVAEYVVKAQPDARSIGATEAGVVGYWIPLDVRLVDFVGLTGPNPEFYSGRHLDRFFEKPPDLVLVHSVQPGTVWPFEAAIFNDRRFAARYELVHVISEAGYSDLTLYRRRAV